jgi:hypothetical protein
VEDLDGGGDGFVGTAFSIENVIVGDITMVFPFVDTTSTLSCQILSEHRL